VSLYVSHHIDKIDLDVAVKWIVQKKSNRINKRKKSR